MAYETILIIGRAVPDSHKSVQTLMELSSIDIGRTEFAHYAPQINPLGATIAVYRGGKLRHEDELGYRLFPVSPEQTLHWLMGFLKNDPYKSRYKTAISLLKNLMGEYSKNYLTCVLFGH